ncbi:MAG TPA: VOC family protein [Saprospiraceae bacterium]|nr:VOC family protein [Saprospiraceae bacterium]
MSYVISGIQQLGVGVTNADQAWKWYHKHFSMDVPIFEERAPAPLMTDYTGGEVRDRYAIMALNMQGGGGFEIWQYTSRTPQPPQHEPLLGDPGIFAGKVKCRDIDQAYRYFQEQQISVCSPISRVDEQHPHFFICDPYGNYFQIVQANNWFQNRKKITGGTYGAIIGVSDIERAFPLYQDTLGYNEIVFDETDHFPDWQGLPGGEHRLRRVVLRHSEDRAGAFAPLLGPTEIELVQAPDRETTPIYKDRFWGDLGFIHLCFDVRNMDQLGEKCTENGHPFTVDSNNSFDMGEAAGRFTYIEDPDGTLIEFVETHKVPIAKRLGWYLNLQGRPAEKNLPRWMIKGLGLNRKKIS